MKGYDATTLTLQLLVPKSIFTKQATRNQIKNTIFAVFGRLELLILRHYSAGSRRPLWRISLCCGSTLATAALELSR